MARSDGGVTNFKAYPYVCYPSALAGHLPFPGRSFDQAPLCRDDPWGVHDEHAKTIGSSLQHTKKLPQKTHRGVNKFALRYAYSHTAVQIYFDCGANFEVFLGYFSLHVGEICEASMCDFPYTFRHYVRKISHFVCVVMQFSAKKRLARRLRQ